MNTKSVSLESAKKGITASFSLRELSDGESEQVRGGGGEGHVVEATGVRGQNTDVEKKRLEEEYRKHAEGRN
jgi:hypothetical protein